MRKIGGEVTRNAASMTRCRPEESSVISKLSQRH